jgi:hypothetical protein
MSSKQSEPSDDIAFLHSPTEDGKGARVLRLRKGKFEAAEVRPAPDGQPLNDQELVRLHPREETPRVCDVEVLHEPDTESAEPEKSAGGPVRVSTRAYRENWDRIFADEYAGEKKPKTEYSLN